MPVLIAVLCGAIGLITAPAFAGYALTTLASFNTATGYSLNSSLTLVGSNLYGTAESGGPTQHGVVFSVPVTGGAPATVSAFPATIGQPITAPISRLALSGGTFYGTTEYGSASGITNGGMVYSVPVTGGTPTVLTSFTGSNGSTPYAGVAVSGNTLYGTTYSGGTNGYGVVFSLPTTGGAPTVLAAFNSSNGANPQGDLVLSGNTLYGTTFAGGANGYGEVFSIPTTGGTPMVLASFNKTNGANPTAGLILSGNTLYGTTATGGPGGAGEVFSLPTSGGAPTVLGSFGNPLYGITPNGGLVLSGNTLFGTTSARGTGGGGNVFSLPTGGGTPTILASFSSTNGNSPRAALTMSGNTLYGTTYRGGASDYGTVFSLSPTIVSLTSTDNPSFGSVLGTLALTGSSGKYQAATMSFPATSVGNFHVTGWNPSTDTQIYGLNVADSVPGNLPADLSALMIQINSATYSGATVTASTVDPTGTFDDSFNFYFTVSNPTLGTSADYFGFDLSQLTGTTDVLTATSIVAIPEPTSLSLLAAASLTLLSCRRDR